MTQLLVDIGTYEIKIKWVGLEEIRTFPNALIFSTKTREFSGGSAAKSLSLLPTDRIQRPLQNKMIVDFLLLKKVLLANFEAIPPTVRGSAEVVFTSNPFFPPKFISDIVQLFIDLGFKSATPVDPFIGIVEVYKQRSKDFLQAQFPGYDSDLKGFFKAVFSAYIEGDDTILKWNDKTLKFSEEDYHHVRKHTIMVESKIAVVLDIGHHGVWAVPVKNGKVMLESIRRGNIGGLVVSNLLADIVTYKQVDIRSATNTIDDMKKKCCYVAENPKEDFDKETTITYNLSTNALIPNEEGATNDQAVTLGNERFVAPEVFFTPTLHQLDAEPSVGEVLGAALDSIENEDDRAFAGAVVCAVGGTCNMRGFYTRLERDIAHHTKTPSFLHCVMPEKTPVQSLQYSKPV
eukprot:TRINITY_DN41051_c0_g1_i1.p1 TRINITY_DN41051_c0_g1~~TRINITY_DN41051_c0_g1_i1.p1  ORF type:complete len:404 (-),score=61.88 TRINITY_DN41051_c0_g1_i1:59-1270(-)